MYLSKFEHNFSSIFPVSGFSGFSGFPISHKIDQYLRSFFYIIDALIALKANRILDSYIYGAIGI